MHDHASDISAALARMAGCWDEVLEGFLVALHVHRVLVNYDMIGVLLVLASPEKTI